MAPAPTRPIRTPYTDPFAPISDEELRARAGRLSKEELAAATAIIEAAINRRSQAGQQAIQGYTGALGGLWQGAAGQTKAAYDQALQYQGGVNTALANRLGSFGQGLQAEEGAKLAQMGAPPSTVPAMAGQTAQGVANAGFARGSAGLEALNAQSAAGQGYAAQLPGIAGLTGLQTSRQLQAQLNKELADQLGGAQRDSQSSFTSMYNHLLDQELQKAIAKQSGLRDTAKIKLDTQYKNSTLKYKTQKAAYDRQIQRQRLGISRASVIERARHDGISEEQAQQKIANERRAAAERARANRAREQQQRRNEVGRNKRSKKKGGVDYSNVFKPHKKK